jgi:hypothetical protein
LGKKQKLSRKDAKVTQRKFLRVLCGSASLRALLFFGCDLFTLGRLEKQTQKNSKSYGKTILGKTV